MRVGLVILPDVSWSENVVRWQAAESLGYDSAWTYDHLWWRSLREEPWYSSIVVLSAVASVTTRIRIGTLVSSPNFRHPVVLAKESVTLDDVSGGRFTLGIGSGSTEAGDALALGGRVLDSAQRADRFEEFVTLTDRLLRERRTTHDGAYYSVVDTNFWPKCIQRPRVPFAIAATRRRGFEMAAKYGNAWITAGPTDWSRSYSLQECVALVKGQVTAFQEACDRAERDFSLIDKIFVSTGMSGDPMRSTTEFVDIATEYAQIGITDFVVHWPRSSGIFAGDPEAVERVAAEALPQVRDF